MAKKKPKYKVRIRKVPKKQVDNPDELHPTKDGILRVTPENAHMAQTMFLNQIRDSNAKILAAQMINNELLTAFLKEIREAE